MKSTIVIFIILFSAFLAKGQESRLYEFVGENGKYGFMEKNGKIKIKPKYLFVKEFNEGLAFVSEEAINGSYKWICINTNGRKIFDISNNFPETNFSCGFARIRNLNEHWFINKKGKNIFRKTWRDGYQEFRNGIAYVSDIQFSEFYPIDKKGKRVGTETFSRLEIYAKTKIEKIILTRELIPFKSENLFGFKNIKGEIIIQPQFNVVGEFEKGICPVKISSSDFELRDLTYNALIDITGKIIIQVDMYNYQGFQGDLIKYYYGSHLSGGPRYLDSTGQKIEPHYP